MLDHYEIEERQERKARDKARKESRNFKFALIFQELTGSPENERESIYNGKDH